MKKIKILREKIKLSQQELANKLGIRQSTVAMWETENSKPRADMLPRLSEIFGCTIDDLYDKEVTNGQAS